MSLGWRWVGHSDYRSILAWQRARRHGVIAGTQREVLVLVEHPRVVTTGRRPPGDLSGVRAAGIEIVETERGGLATWHGPGQLVGYPIIDVGTRKIGVRSFVGMVERVLVDSLHSHGVEAHTRHGFPGAWVGEKKLASIGLHFARGVSMHGFAINLDPDLSDFGKFTACGLDGVEFTSMADQGVAASMPIFAAQVATRFAQAVDTMTGLH